MVLLMRYFIVAFEYPAIPPTDNTPIIAGNIRTFFAQQRSYDGLTNGGVIKKAKLVPDEMWDGDSIKNVWGYNFNIELYDENKNNDSFYLQFKLPEEDCIEIATHDWFAANAFAVSIRGDDSHSFRSPISIDEAIIYCQGTEGDSADGIEIYFK